MDIKILHKLTHLLNNKNKPIFNNFYYIYQDDGFSDRFVKAIILKKIKAGKKVVVVSDDIPWGHTADNLPDFAVLGSGDDLCSVSKEDGVELLIINSFEDEKLSPILSQDVTIVWNCAFSKKYRNASRSIKDKILARLPSSSDVFTDYSCYLFSEDENITPLREFLKEAAPFFDGILCCPYFRVLETKYGFSKEGIDLSFRENSVKYPAGINSIHKPANLKRKIVFSIISNKLHEFIFDSSIRDDYEKLAELVTTE